MHRVVFLEPGNHLFAASDILLHAQHAVRVHCHSVRRCTFRVKGRERVVHVPIATADSQC